MKPKPATGEWTVKSVYELCTKRGWKNAADAINASVAAAQPKPTKGEWTVTFPIGEVSLNGEVFPRTYQDAIQRIADAHNAALATEREKVQKIAELLTQALRPEGGTAQWAKRANAALAKVK